MLYDILKVDFNVFVPIGNVLLVQEAKRMKYFVLYNRIEHAVLAKVYRHIVTVAKIPNGGPAARLSVLNYNLCFVTVRSLSKLNTCLRRYIKHGIFDFRLGVGGSYWGNLIKLLKLITVLRATHLLRSSLNLYTNVLLGQK